MAANLERQWFVVRQPVFKDKVRIANGGFVEYVERAPYCYAQLDEEAGGNPDDDYVVFGDAYQLLPLNESTILYQYEAGNKFLDVLGDRALYEQTLIDGTYAVHYVGPVHWGHPDMSETHWQNKSTETLLAE